MISHTVSGLELAWTLVALAGFIFIALLLARSLVDYEFVLNARVNGLRRYSAVTTIFIFLGGTITQLSYIGVGIVAMTQSGNGHHLSVASYIIAIILMASSIISTVFGLMIYYRRIHLIDMIMEHKEP